MPMPDPGKDPVEKYRHDHEVIRLTAALLIKDFATAGMRLSFSGRAETAFSELHGQVRVAVEALRRDPQKLKSLLYHIDVDERKAGAFPGTDAGALDALVQAIFERALTRAVFRKLYGSGAWEI
jgi:hypothetical protein